MFNIILHSWDIYISNKLSKNLHSDFNNCTQQSNYMLRNIRIFKKNK